MGLVAIPQAPTQAATPDEDAYASAAFKATNKQRVNHDRKALRQSSCLQKYADKQAKKLARDEALSHQSLPAVQAGCDLRRAGENVGYGYPTGKSLVNDGWMHSRPHRANILNGKYRLMAIATRLAGNGMYYTAQVFGGRH